MSKYLPPWETGQMTAMICSGPFILYIYHYEARRLMFDRSRVGVTVAYTVYIHAHTTHSHIYYYI